MKKALSEALEARGYTTLTPVQEAVTQPEHVGADLLVSAQTGSGKTLGFGLAIAPGLLGEAEAFGQASSPLALIIAPTRELALQVKRELDWLYAKAGAVVTSTVGGMDMRDERRALGRGAHVVVATPGRLRDHIMRGSIDLSALKAIVLDEADEMLDLGFREDLEFILGEAPQDRQTLMFSATVPAAIAKLAEKYQKDAVRIATTTGESQHADIDYRAMSVSARDGENAIINVLRYYEAPNAIVFCNTRAMVNRLTTRLSNRGFSVVALSGELSQAERTHALQAMRDGRARVCVATDVAARGIDLPNLDLVVHAELPSNHETLLHRSGRTGRAGRKGVSALIVPPVARKKAQRLLGWAKVRAEWADAPSAEAVTARDEERMLASPDWLEPVPESEQDTVRKLTEQFTPEQIAGAYLKLYRDRHTAPEELTDASAPAKPRPAFGPSVWFSLAGGRAAGAEPRQILPVLCKVGDLTRDDVGAIRVQQDVAFVEIRADAVPGFLAAVGPSMMVEGSKALTRLESPPSFDRSPAPERPPAKTKPRKSERPAPKPHKPDPGPVVAPASPPPQAVEPPPPAAPPAPKPAKSTKPRPGTTVPIDWNDSSVSHRKKPKPGAKPAHGKKPKGPEAPRHEPGTVTPWKSRKPGSGKPGGAGKPFGGKPKRFEKGEGGGSAPPVGKPTSKKNRARAEASGKSFGSKPGGSGPKRGKL